MINVVQILLGDCPPFIEGCMRTVERFAEQNAYTYTIVNRIPTRYAGNTDLRAVSERMRFDILAERKNVLYADWDVELFDGFCVHDGLTFDSQLPDCMVYNHGDTEFFRAARKTVTEDAPLILFNGMRNILRGGYKYRIFNRDTYTHHEYHDNKEFFAKWMPKKF